MGRIVGSLALVALLSGCVSGVSTRLDHSYDASRVLAGLDIGMTVVAVHHGFEEANPIPRAIVDKPAIFIPAAAAANEGILWMFNRLAGHSEPAAFWGSIVYNALRGFVVTHNVRVIVK